MRHPAGEHASSSAANTTPAHPATVCCAVAARAPAARAHIHVVEGDAAEEARNRRRPPVGQLCQQVLSVHRVLIRASSGVPACRLATCCCTSGSMTSESSPAHGSASVEGHAKGSHRPAHVVAKTSAPTAPSKPEGLHCWRAGRDSRHQTSSAEASAAACTTDAVCSQPTLGHLRQERKGGRRPPTRSSVPGSSCAVRPTQVSPSTSEAWRSPPTTSRASRRWRSVRLTLPRAPRSRCKRTRYQRNARARRPLVRPFANSSQASWRRSAAPEPVPTLSSLSFCRGERGAACGARCARALLPTPHACTLPQRRLPCPSPPPEPPLPHARQIRVRTEVLPKHEAAAPRRE